ncbi:MAG: universal stress protein [Nitrosopumilaceae archaeon]
MYKKILVPLDGSRMAEKAFKHALLVAKNFAAELILLTIVPENVVPTGGIERGHTQPWLDGT